MFARFARAVFLVVLAFVGAALTLVLLVGWLADAVEWLFSGGAA